MRVLVLGYEEGPIIEYLKSVDEVFVTSSRLTLEQIQSYDPDFIVSYGYKYILRPPVVRAYPNRIINLHISKLPWNRGYHPNFWSFYDNTPKGVTIHLIDEGIDTGKILLQKDVDFREDEDTLEKTYKRLRKEIEDLFIANWTALRSNQIEPLKQSEASGSHYYRRELEAIWPLLSRGWNTPIREIEDLGKKKMVKNEPRYWEFIRTLRNDPSARENFMNRGITKSEEHKAYMEEHQDKFYICLFEDKPVGYIGINSENYISIAVVKEARGKGLGKYMLQYFHEEVKTRKLRAIVKITNEASLKLFESCGFVKKFYIFEGV